MVETIPLLLSTGRFARVIAPAAETAQRPAVGSSAQADPKAAAEAATTPTTTKAEAATGGERRGGGDRKRKSGGGGARRAGEWEFKKKKEFTVKKLC